MKNPFLLLGAINAMLAVILGAFGAHGLKDRLTEPMLAVYKTAVEYQFYHALGLLLIGLLALQWVESQWLSTSGWLMVAGIVLFSGSLYLLSFGGPRWLGPVTPLGGLGFILAWAALAVAVVKSS